MAAQSHLLPTTRADPRICIPTENVLPWDSQLRPETEAWTQKLIKKPLASATVLAPGWNTLKAFTLYLSFTLDQSSEDKGDTRQTQ